MAQIANPGGSAGTQCPSETQTLMQKKVDTPNTSHSMPGGEGSMTQGACSDAPTPMETGGVGNGCSWVEQVKAATEKNWRRDRPTRWCRSSPKRWDACSTHTFPLQDIEGRHEAIQQLYRHAGEHSLAHHDVAAQGMATHYPDLEAGMAKSLNNMVLCMILEYHLTCFSQGPSYISPVLLEAAKNLLSPMEEYRAGSDFQGTRDARVLEKAKTLQSSSALNLVELVFVLLLVFNFWGML